MKLIRAKKISYGAKRSKSKDVLYIVIHGTGNKGDTAKNNCDYYAKRNNRHAGAHIYVDRQGKSLRSIPLNRVAYAVGGNHKTGYAGEAMYYGKCNNQNSVSIELCDILDKYPSKKQIKALADTIKYVRRYCPKATTVIRHWDVNGKKCPYGFCGVINTKYRQLVKEVRSYGIDI